METKMLALIPSKIFSLLTNYKNRCRKCQIRTPQSKYEYTNIVSTMKSNKKKNWQLQYILALTKVSS